MQIVIEISDNDGTVQVSVDGADPEQFDNTDAAMQFVDDTMSGEESQETPAEDQAEGPEGQEAGDENAAEDQAPAEEPDQQTMWNEEAKTRKSIYG